MSFHIASKILNRLQENGYEAYFVGGAVRDLLLGRKVGDIDIATSAKPEQVTKIFPKIIPVGIDHGTVIVRMDSESFEVTTFRKEGSYKDYRHPESVDFISSITEDLMRRDFTINAIAMTIRGEIIDPFQGSDDLKKKIIKTVGSPDERFQEDPLRMMRGIRFVSTLGFQLSEETRASILRNNYYLSKIAMERISIEFEKMLLGSSLENAIHELVVTELYNYLPGLTNNKNTLLKFSRLNFHKDTTLIEYWALLCYFLQINDVVAYLKRWKLSRRKIREVNDLVTIVRQKRQNKIDQLFIYHTGITKVQAFNRILKTLGEVGYNETELDNWYKLLPIHARKDLVISGSDIIKWDDRDPGPWVEEMLVKIENAVVNGEVKNDMENIEEWVQWNVQYEND